MKGLRLYLSPFAPDTSGAAAVFFGLGALTVIVDAGNIAGFDEPRWQRGQSAVFSAGLRDMDAIMGRDDRLVAKLQQAAAALEPAFIALVSTPVPAVIGTDFRALARLGQKATGLPVVTAECDGTRLYDQGAARAWLALVKEFARPLAEGTATPPRRGLLGVTPLDFSEAEAAGLAANAAADGAEVLLYGAGVTNSSAYTVGVQFIAPAPLSSDVASSVTTAHIPSSASPSVLTGLPALRLAPAATENIVVSAQGLKAARWLQQHYGTPYRVDSLLAADDWAHFQARYSFSGREKILLLHESVRALSLQKLLQAELPGAQVSTAGWFLPADELAPLGARLAEEDELQALAARLQPDLIIADQALQRALPAYRGAWLDWPHYAVSGAR